MSKKSLVGIVFCMLLSTQGFAGQAGPVVIRCPSNVPAKLTPASTLPAGWLPGRSSEIRMSPMSFHLYKNQDFWHMSCRYQLGNNPNATMKLEREIVGSTTYCLCRKRDNDRVVCYPNGHPGCTK